MIISAGVNIYPQEIQDCLTLHLKVLGSRSRPSCSQPLAPRHGPHELGKLVKRAPRDHYIERPQRAHDPMGRGIHPEGAMWATSHREMLI